MVARNDSFALQIVQQTEVTLFEREEPGTLWAPRPVSCLASH